MNQDYLTDIKELPLLHYLAQVVSLSAVMRNKNVES